MKNIKVLVGDNSAMSLDESRRVYNFIRVNLENTEEKIRHILVDKDAEARLMSAIIATMAMAEVYDAHSILIVNVNVDVPESLEMMPYLDRLKEYAFNTSRALAMRDVSRYTRPMAIYTDYYQASKRAYNLSEGNQRYVIASCVDISNVFTSIDAMKVSDIDWSGPSAILDIRQVPNMPAGTTVHQWRNTLRAEADIPPALFSSTIHMEYST